jgi:hypothetical protein
MDKQELIDKIKNLIPQVLDRLEKTEQTAVEYQELQDFPELKNIVVDLLTSDYGKFIDGIDWVSPKPSTFRINLLNGQYFYLVFTVRSWIAEIKGKKYYLLNLSEQEMASNAISKLLRYGQEIKKPGEEGEEEDTWEDVDTEGSEDLPTPDEELE